MNTRHHLAQSDEALADAPIGRFFELSHDLLCIVGADGILRRVNPAFTHMLGWAIDALVSRSYLDFVHADDHARARTALMNRSAGMEPVTGEYRWRCADGSYKWLEWKSSFPDENGLIYAIGRDITHSKRVEAELRALHEHAIVGIGMSDCSGRFLRANPAFCQMLGYSEAELLRMTSFDVTFADDRAAQGDYMARLASGELRSHVVEKRYVRKDGSTVWGRVTLSVIRDETAPQRAMMGVIEDISQTKRTEVALSESEDRYARIASNVPGMMYQSRREADGRTSFSFVSDGAADIYGVSAAELQANPRLVFDVVHPDDRERFDASMASALEMRAPWRWAGRIVINDRVKWLEGASRPQQLPCGATVWDGLLLDVTEARQAASRLEETENRYRSLFEHHPDAVFSLDLDGKFQSANPACTSLCGYEPQEMLGVAFDSLIAPEQLGNAYTRFRQALQGIANTYEITLRHKSGANVEISVTNVPVIVSGEIVGVFGIARDLTRQRELEAQLRQAQKMEAVGQLAAGVAHDFNNVLTVIQGCSEFLAAGLPVGGVHREDVDMIRDAASRAATLTRQLLAFSRKQVLQPAVVDLNGCVTDLHSILGRMAGEDIVLVTELADDLGFIWADAGQLEQVIVNMTVNARDAMPNGGELRLTTCNCAIDEAYVRQRPEATPGPHIRLSVSDTGCGMDDATRSRIFEPFFTTKGTGKGTGLGLSTAYGIIRQSSGHIAVTSAPGAGTTFHIYLPVVSPTVQSATHASAQDASQIATATRPTTAAHGKETVLLVEDDTGVRYLASQMLTREGYGVIEAANGAEALATVRAWNGNIHLVVTDALMPVMNGGELADALASEYPHIKVLFMSLFTGDDIVRRGADSRRAFIPKPFTTAALTQKVRDVLDASPSVT